MKHLLTSSEEKVKLLNFMDRIPAAMKRILMNRFSGSQIAPINVDEEDSMNLENNDSDERKSNEAITQTIIIDSDESKDFSIQPEKKERKIKKNPRKNQSKKKSQTPKKIIERRTRRAYQEQSDDSQLIQDIDQCDLAVIPELIFDYQYWQKVKKQKLTQLMARHIKYSH